MMALLGVARIIAFISLALAYMAVCAVSGVLVAGLSRRRAWRARVTSTAAGIALRIFGIRVSAHHRERSRLDTGRMLAVANHVSYLDILILSSLYRSLYITSVEVQKTFFLGTLAAFGGSLFVERRSKTRLLREIDRVAEVLRSGAVVTLFPEGTSSNGEGVLPFKGALFMAAEKAGANVQPICIEYRAIGGQPVSAANRDLAFYYGDIVFFPHLLRLFFVRSIEVSVTFLDPVDSAGKDRKELADEAYEKIVGAFGKMQDAAQRGGD